MRLRVSELVGLNWGDIDGNVEVVRVKGKGNKERIVPIGRKALDALELYRASIPELVAPKRRNRCLPRHPPLPCPYFLIPVVPGLRHAALHD